MKIIYAAVLVINIHTSNGDRHIRVPMPSMNYCMEAIDLTWPDFETGLMINDGAYSEETYCKPRMKKHQTTKKGE